MKNKYIFKNATHTVEIEATSLMNAYAMVGSNFRLFSITKPCESKS